MAPSPSETSRATGRSFGFLPWLASRVLRLLARTWRFELVEGREAFEGVLEEGEPVIWSLWHNRIAAGAGLLIRRIAPSGMDLALMASASRDGRFAAAAVADDGVRIVRGSSSRGGAGALRGVVRLIRRHRSSPVLVPDGPRGPAYRFKPGTFTIAAMTGTPIVYVGLATRRAWVLRSWDRLVVPKPFARIAVAVAGPVPVPAEAAQDPEVAEALAREAEERLDALCRAAEAAAGTEDPFARDSAKAPLSGGG